MKLRKQTPAKAAIALATAGLLAALFAVVRSQPRLNAQASEQPATGRVDYQHFFAPSSSGAGVAELLQQSHTRTRAS